MSSDLVWFDLVDEHFQLKTFLAATVIEIKIEQLTSSNVPGEFSKYLNQTVLLQQHLMK